MQATARDKIFIADPNILLHQSIVKYFPPLLQITKGALNILANTLQVCGEIPLQSGAIGTLVRAN